MDFTEIKTIVMDAGINLLLGIIILIVGLFLTHWIVKLISQSKTFGKLDPSLQSFFRNLIKILLIVTVVLTAASVLGVPLTSVITIFASAGVAISLGMQGALGNIVGGVTLLILQPIRTGEYVKIGEHTGIVKRIGAFYTEVTTLDNSLISLPNSNLTNAAIINYSREGTSRIEAAFTVSYNSDMDKVRETLLEMARKGEYVLEDPSPWVLVSKCTETGMVFLVRAWAKAENWGRVYYYLVEEGKRALDAAGIVIPVQQMDVRIRQD
ncbi:MAG: mechanosensitive ion channel family protein [Clostridia bacterium]|nr:mechanosensitive ion channel family protein [Clostridia bacterium]